MLRLFRGRRVSALAAMFLLSLAGSHVLAEDEPAPGCGRGTYIGMFGGAGGNSINNVSQVGTALFPDTKGGPLAVNATGSASSRAAGIVGLQFGHEWSGSAQGNGWGLLPAVEFEGFYLAGAQRADLNNPTTRLREHDFVDSFSMNSGIFLTNAVLSLQTPGKFLTPYVGGGVGAAAVSLNNAFSAQVAPPEPGVNHFNSDPNSSCWGFAAQGKVGVRIPLTSHCYVFTEYRLIYVSSTTYTFGPTVYPTHAATTPWTVHLGDMFNNVGVAGIGFNF